MWAFLFLLSLSHIQTQPQIQNGLSTSVMRSMFSRWLKRNGFVRMNIHRMRHIAASLLIAQGVPVKVVQEFLGHSNVTMTLTVYTHTSEQLHRDAVNHFDRLFTGMQ